MSKASRKPSAPDMGGVKDDWGKLVGMRQEEKESDSRPSGKASPAGGGKMTRRSWYVETGKADEFQRIVDDLHFTHRVPKHVVVSQLLQVAIERSGDAEVVERVQRAAGQGRG